jgi:carbamoyltransferase
LKAYLGVACTGHENALALLDDGGSILHAEATERPLQHKRAINIPADDQLRVAELIERHCGHCDEIVMAKTWSADAHGSVKADATKMMRAVVGSDARIDREWINRVAFQATLWESLIGPNVQLAGTGIQRYCATRAIALDKRAYDHHLTHAAYGCYISPFDDAVCAVFDGYGEGSHSSFFHYKDESLVPLQVGQRAEKLYGSLGSLGLYYGYTICGLLGFDIVNGEEWKVMGLAPYGKFHQAFYEALKRYIRADGCELVVGRDGGEAYRGLQQFARRPGQSFLEMADIAYTAQHYFCELAVEVLRRLSDLNLSRNLVLTGGCALNSTLNGQLTATTGFERVFVPPAPSDDGNAVGAAFLALREDGVSLKGKTANQSPYLGSSIDPLELQRYLCHGATLRPVDIDPSDVTRFVAQQLASGKIVAWVQGRAEFGPRALGNRSILADPRDPAMKDRINEIVKFREGFRPFAPSILHEHGDAYFEGYTYTPYMERTLKIRADKRDEIAAVCHVDGTGRLQSVTRELNPKFHELISSFYALTQVPVLLNTSLNVMGKPIVHSAGDAFCVFLSTGIDVLVIENCVYSKASV